jgi:predicted DNA-binding transcriptional regulator AlpA
MLAKTGLAATTQWRLERLGLFPARRQISIGLVGWVEDEVEQWIADRATVIVGSVKPVAVDSKRGRKPKRLAGGVV